MPPRAPSRDSVLSGAAEVEREEPNQTRRKMHHSAQAKCLQTSSQVLNASGPDKGALRNVTALKQVHPLTVHIGGTSPPFSGVETRLSGKFTRGVNSAAYNGLTRFSFPFDQKPDDLAGARGGRAI